MLTRLRADDVTERVDRFKPWVEAVMQEMHRDASHGMNHFERVRQGALELAEKTRCEALSADESLLLQLAALCHDILDHKYLDNNDVFEKRSLESEMRRALAELSGLSPTQVADVCLISENVSLSKELAGRMDEDQLMERSLLHLRNYVSDADKLDALGIGGVKRLAQYQMHRFHEEGVSVEKLSSEYLKVVAEAHLLHRAEYLRTPEAMMRGRSLLTETKVIIQSPEALKSIIEKVRHEQSLVSLGRVL